MEVTQWKCLSILVKFLAPHGALNLAIRIGLLQCLSLVVSFFAFANRDDAFCHAPIRKVNSKRNHRKPTFFGAASESRQLASVQEQFADTFCRMIPNRRLPILIDLTTHQPHFAILQSGISFFDRASPVSKAFDFASMQYKTAFDRIKDFVLMTCLAIFGDGLVRRSAGRLGFGRFRILILRLAVRGRLLRFLLVQCLLAHSFWHRGEFENGKIVVELIGGRIKE